MFKRIMACEKKLCSCGQMWVINTHAVCFAVKVNTKSERVLWVWGLGCNLFSPVLFLTLHEYRSVRGESWKPWFSLHSTHNALLLAIGVQSCRAGRGMGAAVTFSHESFEWDQQPLWEQDKTVNECNISSIAFILGEVTQKWNHSQVCDPTSRLEYKTESKSE